ncbi:Uma2 family endonuclease [Starkeya sp. ORNL1]|uniref:Uma2 family endonuclease n=1 Tax=Starkeya sp. ORNL1 TaxID=2709380 RepID=UPI0014628062|nr:Uma2 family endonuclease [Starkeya sp. ORNL1]QJP12916.1 Uma2 family endonuclease [Starkeya sp. ORNL1]
MNLRTDIPMTKEAFLRWVQRQEGNYEYVRGKVVMMVRVTRNHGFVTRNLLLLLSERLSSDQWNVFADALAVDIGESIRCPDIVVEPVGGEGSSVFTDAPVLLAEVLSPSSLETDLHEKAEEYTALPSLQAYVVLAQDEPRLWVWQRDGDGLFPRAGEMIEGSDAVLELPALGIELPLVAIYRGVR